jgi:hypothetical protein
MRTKGWMHEIMWACCLGDEGKLRRRDAETEDLCMTQCIASRVATYCTFVKVVSFLHGRSV